ncbi:YwmB family TATA-box binding protein [Brevibacillus dissolubilis]|uniref:YwmB family TATA-box binding protein n=1 Tax=Brevibacillus dissolubilis TaxID=1844116 RepID=UPI001115B6C6|nr:YwmB family TATA-box binding protein [Brevibacillus dissolubilis]
MGKNNRLSVMMFVLMALLLLAFLYPVSAKEAGEPSVTNMLEALEATGATATDITMRTSVALPFVDSSKELLALGQEWSKRLSVPVQSQLSREKHNVVYQSQGVWGKALLSIRLIGVEQSGKVGTYLVVSLSGKRSHLQDIENLRQYATNELKNSQLIPQFSTCIRGIYSDKMSVGWQKGKILGIFQALGAREVERLEDESVISVSAYTREWRPFIMTGNQKMNLQVATHVDKNNQLTRITIGTPIITAEY